MWRLTGRLMSKRQCQVYAQCSSPSLGAGYVRTFATLPTATAVSFRDAGPYNGCYVQGYIYVEADREAHVKEAVSGLRAVFQSKPARLVPLKEMVDALTTSKKGDPLLGMAFESQTDKM